METRCKKCQRLFFKGELNGAKLEIKCPKCGYVQKIPQEDKKTLDR